MKSTAVEMPFILRCGGRECHRTRLPARTACVLIGLRYPTLPYPTLPYPPSMAVRYGEMDHRCEHCRFRSILPAELPFVPKGRVVVAVCDVHKSMHTHATDGGLCAFSQHMLREAEMVCTVTGEVQRESMRVHQYSQYGDRPSTAYEGGIECHARARGRGRVVDVPPPRPRPSAGARSGGKATARARAVFRLVEGLVDVLLHPARSAAAPSKQRRAAESAYAEMMHACARSAARTPRGPAPILSIVGAYLLATRDGVRVGVEKDLRRVEYYTRRVCDLLPAVAWVEGKASGAGLGDVGTHYVRPITLGVLYTMTMPGGLRRKVPVAAAAVAAAAAAGREKGPSKDGWVSEYVLPPDPWLRRILPAPPVAPGQYADSGLHLVQHDISRAVKRVQQTIDTLVDAVAHDPTSSDARLAVRHLRAQVAAPVWFDVEGMDMRARGRLGV